MLSGPGQIKGARRDYPIAQAAAGRAGGGGGTLEAGDVLYFPAGVFHEVESLDDDNISLNISLMAPTTAEVICGALRHRLLCTDAGRERVTSDAAGLAKLGRAVRRRQGEPGDIARLRGLTVGMICPPALTEPRGAVAGSDDDDDDDDDDDATTSRRLTSRTRRPGWRARRAAAGATLEVNQLYSLQPRNSSACQSQGPTGSSGSSVCVGTTPATTSSSRRCAIRLVMDRTDVSSQGRPERTIPSQRQLGGARPRAPPLPAPIATSLAAPSRGRGK